jgi:hypothetical protein
MHKFLVLIIFFCGCLNIKATLPPALEREVTIAFNKESVLEALQKIQKQTSVIFSYQTHLIENLPPITLQLKKVSVREVLSFILPKKITYKVRGNYIILKEGVTSESKNQTEVKGYVYDKQTQKKLANVTIYDKASLKSVTTDEYGYYSITLPKEQQCLKVNKENYKDTCVPVLQNETQTLVNIPIDIPRDSLGQPDTLNWKKRIQDFGINTKAVFGKLKGYINTLNVRDTFSRPFQISFLPFLGSNGLMSGNVYNDVSINVLGGFSRGTSKFEAASLFNINREKLNGVQLAGMLNVVGDSVEGAQFSGLVNVTGRHISGIQAAGFANLNLGEMKGMQAAGLFNSNIKKTEGVQLAGLFNLNTSDVNGLQLAGLMNVNASDYRGLTVSGMLNVVSDTLEGASGSGLLNLTWFSNKAVEIGGLGNICGEANNNTQVASLVNTTLKGSSRIQVSAFLNCAKHISGFQIGMFNYADSASGIPIGFLSIVRKGLHQLEISSDEMIYTNLNFRTGVNLFHNILSIGVGASNGNTIWQFGYGLGSSLKISEKWRLDISGTAHHLSANSFFTGMSERYMLYAGIEFKLAPKIKLALGPTFNFYFSDQLLPDYDLVYSKLAPSYASSKNLANDYNMKSWLGLKASIRFL